MNSHEHQQLVDSITWVLNGSASPAQRAALMQHLPQCSDCQAEWAFQQQLLQAAAPAPRAQDPEAALQRFWAQAPHLSSAEALALLEPEAHAAALQAQAAWASPLGQASPPPRRPAWSLGLGLLAAVLAAHALVLGWAGRPSGSGSYELMSQPANQQAGQQAPASPPRLRLVPAPQMPLADLQQLLQREGLEIVEASRAGLHFGLAPQRAAGFDAKASAARLRLQPGVLLAEPLP